MADSTGSLGHNIPSVSVIPPSPERPSPHLSLSHPLASSPDHQDSRPTSPSIADQSELRSQLDSTHLLPSKFKAGFTRTVEDQSESFVKDLAISSIQMNGLGASAVGAAGASDSEQGSRRFTNIQRLVHEQAQEDEESELRWSTDGAWTPYLLKLSLVAGCSGLLFGWDTGVASGVLVAFKSDLGHPLSAGEQEFVVSATTIGAIFGSLIASKASDWLGRKRVILIAAFLFLLGSLEQTASNDVPQLILGRFIVGVAVGEAATVVPLYLAEIAPSSLRGRIVGTNSLLVTGGQVVAYLVNAALFPVAHGWRWMVLCSGVPALVQLFGLLSLDESPRWLVNKGQFIQARRVLKKIYPLASDEAIDRQVDRILASLKASGGDTPEGEYSSSPRGAEDGEIGSGGPTRSKWSLLFKEPQNRRALILAAGLQAFQQATGFNALMYYSSRLLLIAGPPFDRNPNGFAVLIALANFIGTIVAMRFVDSLGRRRLLLWTTAAMGVALSLLAGTFAMIGNQGGDVVDPTSSSPTAPHAANPWAIITLALMVLFTLSYALGQGIVPWLVLSEVFSGQVRSLGSGLASCANWSVNLFWSATYLSLVQLVHGPAGTFIIFAVISIFSWAFTYKFLPELKGVSINEVGKAFGQNVDSGSAGRNKSGRTREADQTDGDGEEGDERQGLLSSRDDHTLS
ncbi:unnamed protein product [Sympodiomycopsis kandeliae]